MLANSCNHKQWPDVVAKDVLRHMGSFKGEVYLFSGQVKGKTLLPLPQHTDLIVKAADSEKRYVH